MTAHLRARETAPEPTAWTGHRADWLALDQTATAPRSRGEADRGLRKASRERKAQDRSRGRRPDPDRPAALGSSARSSRGTTARLTSTGISRLGSSGSSSCGSSRGLCARGRRSIASPRGARAGSPEGGCEPRSARVCADRGVQIGHSGACAPKRHFHARATVSVYPWLSGSCAMVAGTAMPLQGPGAWYGRGAVAHSRLETQTARPTMRISSIRRS